MSGTGYIKYTRSCYLCKNKQFQKGTASCSFHKFPSDTKTRLMWLQACDLTERDNVSTLKICSDHFLADDYANPNAKEFGGRLALKFGAVPSIKVPNPCKPVSLDMTPTVNVVSSQLSCLQEQDMIGEQEISIEELKLLQNMNVVVFDTTYSPQTCTVLADPLKEEPTQQSFPTTAPLTLNSSSTIPGNSSNTRKFMEPRYVGDIKNPDLATPETARRCLAIAKRTVEKQAKKIKVLQQANRRLRKRVESLKELVKCLPKKRLKYDDDTDTYVLVV
ncbi:hypothetical protein ILUMI_02274 [Ignelater luminosus]|uniref:THAP-type domain-containing protein n=1 Tax=Ignelater luminosus TaxID=2038154 RepID=A0A8K0DDQ9_IGNLU|nr:hypothetical protein ILUMI_02274 [Ignelater luminosus]